eukprot:3015885-Prorocentrum_lima.AAC.1
MGWVCCEGADPRLRHGLLACRAATVAHSPVEVRWLGISSFAAADARFLLAVRVFHCEIGADEGERGVGWNRCFMLAGVQAWARPRGDVVGSEIGEGG